MAATILKRSAVIWVPPRAIGERAFASERSLVLCPAPASGEAARPTRSSLEALEGLRSVVLVFDARDVSLLPVTVPPLSGARLARALPNLVEDALLQDAQACAFALGPRLSDGRRLVAVIDRSWLEFVVGAFERRGMRVSAAWPAQLALPLAADRWSVACVQGGLAVRTGESEGFGWSAAEDAAGRAEALVAAIDAAAHAAAPPAGIDVFLESPDWQPALDEAAKRLARPLSSVALPLPQASAVDLLSARQGTAGGRWLAAVDWRSWRLPAALALACVLVFLIGLNLHWSQLAGERDALRRQMELSFREAFPSAQVVVDPLLQMQRQVADLRLGTGQSGPSDFMPLLTRFSEALGPRSADGIAALEYREGRLKVRLREGLLDGPSAQDSLRAACLERGLSLELDPQQPSTVLVGART